MLPRRGRTTTNPRKLPVQSRAKATVDVITEAAARILTREGVDALTTNRIAEVAGVSVGSVYQYFPNKEAIVATLYEARLEDSRSLIEALSPAKGKTLDESIRELVEVLTRLAFDDTFFPSDIKAFIKSGSAPKLSVEKSVTEHFRLFLDAHRSELDVQDLGLSAAFCTAVMHGVFVATREKSIAASSDQIVNELTVLILRYLRGSTA